MATVEEIARKHLTIEFGLNRVLVRGIDDCYAAAGFGDSRAYLYNEAANKFGNELATQISRVRSLAEGAIHG
jgi:hypothetical protein